MLIPVRPSSAAPDFFSTTTPRRPETGSSACRRHRPLRSRLTPRLRAALLATLLLPAGEVAAAPEAEVSERDERSRSARTARTRGNGHGNGGAPPAPRRSSSQAQTGESGARPPQTAPQTGVSVGERGISLVSEDRSIKLRLTGRIHLDANSFRSTRPFTTTGEGFLIRRGWYETYLNYLDTWEAGLQIDTSNLLQPVFDAVVAYRGFKPFIITAGNLREPFSLQQMSNINQDTFIERAAVDALAPARSVGVTVGANGERWTAVVGGFLGNINRGVEMGGQAVTARATYAPYLEKTDLVHLGIAGSYRSFDGNDRPTTLNSLNATDAVGAAFITTRAISGASSLARLGLEAAVQLGPVRVQGEYIRNEVERDLLPLGAADRRSRRFDGAYVEAAIPLNGPPRVYRIQPNYGTHFGIFGDMTLPDDKRVSRGGLGVFELAGRIGYLDLRDAPTGGGFERSWTVDLSWRPEPNVKIKLDHSRYEVRRPVSNGGDVDIALTEMRLQYYW
ncbi:OprO/OprP family phosphate-selective porin [Methylorubrum populi]|uniref:OprO/OprP family phosphate-selective porin n=1 Tax=Methylorubrum populi TaxID=223967 RepID=A0A921DZ92_9HYPH|nr:OprO/OprP family phosphate-selective porin [Methylorubrum populi]